MRTGSMFSTKNTECYMLAHLWHKVSLKSKQGQCCTEPNTCIKVGSLWMVCHVRLFVTPWTAVCQAPLFLEVSRQVYWSGCHAYLPGIFLTQGPNPGLPHCRQILYLLSHQGNPYDWYYALLSWNIQSPQRNGELLKDQYVCYTGIPCWVLK